MRNKITDSGNERPLNRKVQGRGLRGQEADFESVAEWAVGSNPDPVDIFSSRELVCLVV